MAEETTDTILKVSIVKEMRKSYLDYAMSVIVGRALPDARDGLKPVHRRVLYAMKEMGSGPRSSYKNPLGLLEIPWENITPMEISQFTIRW